MRELQSISDTVKHVYLTIALIGVLFVALAILIPFYPAILFVLVSLAFLIMGIALIALAVKLHYFWTRIPDFLKK